MGAMALHTTSTTYYYSRKFNRSKLLDDQTPEVDATFEPIDALG
jgi:hypothetical protein